MKLLRCVAVPGIREAPHLPESAQEAIPFPGNQVYQLARCEKLHYAGRVASGFFPPGPLWLFQLDLKFRETKDAV
jgi:hypothetical protein